MPMIGLPKSSSPKPTARSMARLGERDIPLVMASERSMAGGIVDPCNLPIGALRAGS